MPTIEDASAVLGLETDIRRAISKAEMDLGINEAWPITSKLLEALEICDVMAEVSNAG